MIKAFIEFILFTYIVFYRPITCICLPNLISSAKYYFITGNVIVFGIITDAV